jgi:hypothetical protein
VTDVTEIRVDDPQSVQRLAAEASTPLVWLLEAGARPCPGALSALLEHAPGPAASLAVDSAGRPFGPLLGRLTESDLDGILHAVEGHQLPLRHIHPTSLLVERDLVLEISPPDPQHFGWYAGIEWSFRLFSLRLGALIPESRVEVDGCSVGSPLQVFRVSRSANWRKGETLRELHRSIATKRR